MEGNSECGGSRAEALVLSPRFRSNGYLDRVRALRSGLPALRHLILLNEVFGESHFRDVRAEGIPLPEVASLAPASLQFTSGITGLPKGALLTHEGMLANAWGTAQRLRLTAEDRVTSIIPLFHCAGCIMGILACLQSGAVYVGVAGFDAEEMCRVIAAERCTALSGVPTSWLAMRDQPTRKDHDLSSLRTGTCGGADANPAILADCVHDFPVPGLVQVYGQTDASTLVSCPDCEDPERLETAGEPLPGMELRIVEPATGAVQPPGEVGEIQVRGPMVMLGYWERPEAKAETITPDGWLRSGDLGALTPTGRLRMAGGRLRDMLIRGGENTIQGHRLIESGPMHQRAATNDLGRLQRQARTFCASCGYAHRSSPPKSRVVAISAGKSERQPGSDRCTAPPPEIGVQHTVVMGEVRRWAFHQDAAIFHNIGAMGDG